MVRLQMFTTVGAAGSHQPVRLREGTVLISFACFFFDLLKPGIFKSPISGESNKQQMYGSFEGFPLKIRALFGLVIHHDPC